MGRRFWWADDSDLFLTENKIKGLRQGQFAAWTWLKWDKDIVPEGQQEAVHLIREITLPSMFGDGKVVYTYGVPECHPELAEEIGNIPDSIVFIIVSRPNRTFSLHKKATQLGPSVACVDVPFDLVKKDAVSWLQKRATALGASMDEMACRVLADFVGLSPNRLTREIAKLRSMAEDGRTITPYLVERECCATGDAEVTDMTNAVLAGSAKKVYELARRLIAKGEPPVRICGFLVDWARKLCIAEAYGREIESVNKGLLAGLKRLEKDKDKNGVEKTRLVPLVNPNAMYYACNGLSDSGKPKGWCYTAYQTVYKAQIDMKTSKDALGILQWCVARLMNDDLAKGDILDPAAEFR